MTRLAEIRDRRTLLVARAAIERERLTRQIEIWRPRLAMLDRGMGVARTLRRHPEWIAAAIAVYAIARPRRLFTWLQRGYLAWRAWRWLADKARTMGGLPA